MQMEHAFHGHAWNARSACLCNAYFMGMHGMHVQLAYVMRMLLMLKTCAMSGNGHGSLQT